MGVERQQQRGTLLDKATPDVPVAMNAAFMAFGVSKPALQLEVVLR